MVETPLEYERFFLHEKAVKTDPAKAFAGMLASYEHTPVANLSTLIARAYLREHGEQAETRKIQRECGCEFFRR